MNEQTNEQQLSTETPSVSSTPDTELAALRTENLELKNQLRLRSARDEITRLLTAENARSPELLFDAISPHLEFDDEGKLASTGELITDLKRRFPEQFVVEKSEPPRSLPVPNIDSGAGRVPNRPPLTKEALAKMSPRDIARLPWTDVRHVLEQ